MPLSISSDTKEKNHCIWLGWWLFCRMDQNFLCEQASFAFTNHDKSQAVVFKSIPSLLIRHAIVTVWICLLTSHIPFFLFVLFKVCFLRINDFELIWCSLKYGPLLAKRSSVFLSPNDTFPPFLERPLCRVRCDNSCPDHCNSDSDGCFSPRPYYGAIDQSNPCDRSPPPIPPHQTPLGIASHLEVRPTIYPFIF